MFWRAEPGTLEEAEESTADIAVAHLGVEHLELADLLGDKELTALEEGHPRLLYLLLGAD